MTSYRCYFRGESGRFESRQDFGAETDDEAIAKARRLCTDNEAKAGFELWSGVHLVVAESTVGE